MKKVLLLVLIAVIAATSFITLSACVENKLDYYEKLLKNHKGIINLTVWSYYNNDQAIAFAKFIDDFNTTIGKEKGIFVTSEKYSKVTDLTQAVEDAASGKVDAVKLPNIFQSYSDDLLSISSKYGVVAPLQNYFVEEELSAYVDGFLREGYMGEDLMIIPTAKSTEVFMLNLVDWNKFAAEVSGVSLDALKTVEGVAATAEKYFNWCGKAFFGRDAMANYIITSAESLNSSLFNINGSVVTPTFDKTFFQKIYDNYYVPYVKGHFSASKQFRSDDIKYGTIASYIGSSASANYFPSNVIIDDEASVATECYVGIPSLFEGGKEVAIQQGAGFAVTKSDEVTEYASCLFLKYLSEPSNNKKTTAAVGYLPVVKDALDYSSARKEYIDYQIDRMIDTGKLANDSSAINAAIAKLEVDKKSVLETYQVTLNFTKTYEMYYLKPFNGSSGIRKIFDFCIQGTKPRGLGMENLKNATDLVAAIDAELLLSGKSRNQLIAEKLNGNFDIWFAELQNVVASYLSTVQVS